jgi:hypothetical protein
LKLAAPINTGRIVFIWVWRFQSEESSDSYLKTPDAGTRRPFSIDAGPTNGRLLFLLFASAEAGAHILPTAAKQGALVPNLAG